MALAVFGERMLGGPIELAAHGVTLDLFVETCGIERLELGSEAVQLLARQGGNRLFDVLDGHGSAYSTAKAGLQSGRLDRKMRRTNAMPPAIHPGRLLKRE